MNNPYDFQNVVAAKLLIKKGDQILLLREPLTNEWMPGRLGLPGGKPVLHESLSEALQRKIKTEVGIAIDIKGLVKVIDIIMPEKTVYHFVIAAEYVAGDIDVEAIEADDMRWFTIDEVSKLLKNDFTEYYNDEVIKDYLAGMLNAIPMSVFVEQDNRTDEIMDWMVKGQSIR